MMKFILDTNVLISALLKDSVTREMLLFPSFEFLLPEFALDEIESHKKYISKRSGLTAEEIDVVLSLVLESVSIIPASAIKPFMKKALAIIGHIDPSDAPFIALALSHESNGIWSNDKHLENVKEVHIWKTQDILSLVARE